MEKTKIVPDGCMITSSGVIFNLMDPKMNDVRINDIAHNLSQQCRWNGSTRTYYSVAEHSIKVYEAYVMKVSLGNDHSRKGALAALLHDAEEAYWGDIIQPIKDLYPEIEEKLVFLRIKIIEKFGSNYIEYMDDIEKYDDQILQWENKNLIQASKVTSNHPILAERQFLAVFESLQK